MGSRKVAQVANALLITYSAPSNDTGIIVLYKD